MNFSLVRPTLGATPNSSDEAKILVKEIAQWLTQEGRQIDT